MSLKDLAFIHLLTELTLYARENQSGTILPRTLVYIEGKEVAVIPDIVFVKRARSGIIQKNRICGVPDLVVEIVSNPSHRDKLLSKKKDTYTRCEVPEYWVADPFEQMVRKYVLNEGAYQETDNSRLLPDLMVQLPDS
ncbi:Uma2 family endonuclease [Aneurinibacillus thermoaerophilus]|uniref:Uma2 family endonuclease n=1 Tax=Aneurinibacillus thermoaerophilus TaxID=143495 RepID=UPI002E20CB64|nr:Uma2 family endonuclease [Aneurinibacillus thermoaerophilus]